MPPLSLLVRSSVFIALLCLTLALSSPVLAADSPTTPAPSRDQTAQAPAAQFIQQLGDRAIGIIANKQMTADQRNAEFSRILNDSFDLKTIGRFVIGRTWNAATPEQQSEYTDLFKSLVIKNYGERMTLYTGEGFQVVSSHPESEMDTTVVSEITHPDGSQPTMIDWRVRNKDGKMGVIDVVVEGVSLSVTQRQEYASVIQRNDGKIDGLLQMMRDELKAPSPSANASKSS